MLLDESPQTRAHTRHRAARAHWLHLAFYGAVVALVAGVGGLAIWFFIERQSLVVAPEPLPKVTVVTTDTSEDGLAAAWVRLLTKAELNPTLVSLENFDPIEGVVVFCDVEAIPPRLALVLDEFVRRGGALAFAGVPPRTPIGRLRLSAELKEAGGIVRFTDSASPIHARLQPGATVKARPAVAAVLKETPRIVPDARWAGSAGAAMVHLEVDRGRYLWFGFDPDALILPDRDLELALRSAFRWVSGQPVSEGAAGDPRTAKTLTPDARREARNRGFAFSVDRSRTKDVLTVRMINRGGVPIVNPTVKVWLPPTVTRVELGGDLIMNRGVSLTGVPEEGAVLVTLPRLARNEDRVMKLRIVERKPPERPPARL